MAKADNSTGIDTSTEEKIKEAARAVFTSKGYAATKVRDIAAEANINLALVNYYFRSKEKLFDIIMTETIQKLFEKIRPIIYDESTTIAEKIEGIVDEYITMLIEAPDLPLFVVNEIMAGSNKPAQMAGKGEMFMHSHFVKQILALQAVGKIPYHPINIMMNMIGMLVFPFLSRRILIKSGAITNEEFMTVLMERKKLIPVWLGQIMNL